jgi:hypothetical protein
MREILDTRALVATVTLLAPFLPSCQTSEDAPDDPVLIPTIPAVEAPTACEPRFGLTYVMDSMRILPPEEGLDLDGDGAIDNALGFLADAINPGWAVKIRTGRMIQLWDLQGWKGPSDPTPAGISMDFYKGRDADEPVDASNNLAGQGTFVVATGQFDVSCQPTSRLERVSMSDGIVDAETSLWEFYEPSVGTVQISDFRLRLHTSADGQRGWGMGGGAYTLCGLSNISFPGDSYVTLLDFLVNATALPADVDRDGDGIERIEGDGTGVVRCLDGDGTVIGGHDCACDPRISDGYSVAMAGTGVRARIVGVTDDASE